ncbi:MAG: hypothetical protein JHD16_12830, partial [Solirubrobacteraceae bacterium]|nr:hypothetical protein [Solirubrobacteraceae bacterium]
RATGSRWAGVTATALVICGGVGMRGTLWSLNTHGPAAFHVALIGAALTLAVARRQWLTGLRGWGAALALGLVTAVGATDPIVIGLGIGPLLAASGVLWFWRNDTAVLRMAVFVSVIGVAGAKFLDKLAVDAQITWTQKALKFVDIGGVVEHLNFLPGVAARMASISPFGAPVGPGAAVAMAAALTAMLAAAAVLVTGVRVFKRAVWPERFGLVVAGPATTPGPASVGDTVDAATTTESAPATSDTVPAAGAAVDDPERVFVAALVFWFSVLAINLLAFVFTTAAIDVFGGRYLVSGWVALCVLIPLLAVRLELRWLAGVTATILCVASTYHLIKQPSPTFESALPTEGLANEVQRFAEANGAKYGYAGFWDSIPITWHTRFGTQAYPILPCGERNCRFYQHYIDSWYTPKPGRSYLVIDPAQPLQPLVDPAYGKPVATKQIGPVTVHVYERDIAAQFG